MASSKTTFSSEPHAVHIEILKGQGNYVRWLRDLKPVAESRNLWSLLSGDEEVLDRPERPVRPQSATLPLRTTRSSAKKAAAANSGTATPDEDAKGGATLPIITSEAYRDAIEDFKLAVSDYRLDLDEYEKQDHRIRQAKGLLAMSVDPAIRSVIADISDPEKAFTEIKSICQMTDTRALGIALSNIEELKFTKNDTVASFLNNIILIQNDINDLGGSYNDQQVIAKVIRSLPASFSTFVSHWNMFAGTPSLPNTVKELYSQLLSAEAQQPQRGRGTEPRGKNGRTPSDKPANRLLPCCGKTGTHKQEDCWTLHPEKRKSAEDKPPKPRANLVTDADENKSDDKDNKKEKKDKKPVKVSAQAIITDRESFERMCAEAFNADFDLQLAINTPLPSDDNESIYSYADYSVEDEYGLHVVGQTFEDDTTTSDKQSSDDDALKMYDGDYQAQSSAIPLKDAFISVPIQEQSSGNIFDLHHVNFSFDQAVSSLGADTPANTLENFHVPGAYPVEHSPPSSASPLPMLEEELRALGPPPTTLPQNKFIFRPRRSTNAPSSSVSPTLSEESAINEALQEYDEHYNDRNAQAQLAEELEHAIGLAAMTVARNSPETEGTTPRHPLPSTSADSPLQIMLFGFQMSHTSSKNREIMDQWVIGVRRTVRWAMVILKEVRNLEGNAWIADSGASVSIANDKSWFKDFRSFRLPMGTAAGDEQLNVEGGGIVSLQLDIGDGQPVELELYNVAYAPNARCNILSLSQIGEKARLQGRWSADEITIETSEGIHIGTAPCIDGLYHVQLAPNSYPDLPPRVMLTHGNGQPHEAPPSHSDQDSDQDSDQEGPPQGDVSDDMDASNTGELGDGGESGDDQRNAHSEDGGALISDEHNDSDSDQAESEPDGSSSSSSSSDDDAPIPPPVTEPEFDYNDPVWKWHRRLGHLGFDNMIKLLKVAEGIDLTEKQIKARIKMICPVCATTKAVNRVPRDPATHRRNNPGELVHIDTWGPYPIPGHDGSFYQLALVDDATRFTWTERIKAKSELPQKLKKMHKRIERRHNLTIAAYRLDNELPSYNKVKRWVEKHGISVEPAIPYRHFMNGVVERGFRTERERASAMMRETHLAGRIADIVGRRAHEALSNTLVPEDIWPEAFELAVWLKNRSPSRALKGKITPWEALYGVKPDLLKERIFGSRLYLTIPPEHRRKTLLMPRGRLLYFVGYESEAVMLAYDSDKHKVERVTTSRVDDGIGTLDTHGRPAVRDREEQQPDDQH
ncbi:hypothetical protein KCU73_g3120, partial [Aureobasidium melanogenum]